MYVLCYWGGRKDWADYSADYWADYWAAIGRAIGRTIWAGYWADYWAEGLERFATFWGMCFSVGPRLL